jgi:hypothetical protein
MSEVNKTQAIRELLKDNPKLMPLEITNLLKEKGVEVTRGFASVVKSNYNKKPKTNDTPSFSAKKKRIQSKSNQLDVSILLDVKKICDKYGKEAVADAISVLSQLS